MFRINDRFGPGSMLSLGLATVFAGVAQADTYVYGTARCGTSMYGASMYRAPAYRTSRHRTTTYRASPPTRMMMANTRVVSHVQERVVVSPPATYSTTTYAHRSYGHAPAQSTYIAEATAVPYTRAPVVIEHRPVVLERPIVEQRRVYVEQPVYVQRSTYVARRPRPSLSFGFRYSTGGRSHYNVLRSVRPHGTRVLLGYGTGHHGARLRAVTSHHRRARHSTGLRVRYSHHR